MTKQTQSRTITRSKSGKASHSVKGGSTDANRMAVAILEVLAGLRTPTDAAEVLGVSLPRYYQLETRALEGFVAACEPRRKGRVTSLESRLKQLEGELSQAQAECARQQALVRAAQRTIGLKAAAAPPPKKKTAASSRRRKRRPTVRALKAVAALQESSRNVDRVAVEGGDAHQPSSLAGSSTDARTHDSRTAAGPSA